MPLCSIDSSLGNILLDNLWDYLSMFNVKTGKRLQSDEEEPQRKQARDICPDNEMEKGL